VSNPWGVWDVLQRDADRRRDDRARSARVRLGRRD
jgi:hypothetical protein